MSQFEKTWFLANAVEKAHIGPLDLKEARAYVARFSEKQMESWLAWRAGWEQWLPAGKVEDLFKEMDMQEIAPPPVPEPAKAPQVDRRRHPRHEVRLRVIIRNEQLTFRTFSKDISLSGIQLENPVPASLFGNDCQIFIASPQMTESIRFRLNATARADLRYFAFADLEPAFVEKLVDWIRSLEARKVPDRRKRRAA